MCSLKKGGRARTEPVAPHKIKTKLCLFWRVALGQCATLSTRDHSDSLRGPRHAKMRLAPRLLLLLLSSAAASAYTPCRAPYATPLALQLETPCAHALLTAGELQVRRYAAPGARAVQLVRANLTAAVASFPEAVDNGALFLLCYFQGACSTAHAEHYASRTVPLLVRPPRQGGGGGGGAWLLDMALAPSQWPGAAPAGEDGLQVLPLAQDTLVAALHCAAGGAPGPTQAEFEACAARLQAQAGALRAAGWELQAAGEWSPTYAYFTGQNQSAPPYDFEVWASVQRAAAAAAAPAAAAPAAAALAAAAPAAAAPAAAAPAVAAPAVAAPVAAAPPSARLASGNWTVAVAYNATLNTVLVTELTFFAAGAFTASLAMQPGNARFPFTSASTLLVAGAGSLPATCAPAPCAIALAPDGASLVVSGLTHGGLDAETWTLALEAGGARLSWRANRTVASAHTLLSDRLALAFQTIGAPPIHGSQIPSWLDLAMRFNESAGAGYALGEGQYEYLSGAAQVVKWAPTNARMAYAGEAAGSAGYAPAFSYAKPAMDGTAEVVTLGVQGLSGAREAGAGVALAPGAVLQRGFSLTLLPEEEGGGGEGGFPSLNFTLPPSPDNDRFAALLREFASVQNMFAGTFAGNNPASVVCLHEMGWFPLVQSIYPAGSLGLAAVQREFEYFARCGWDNGASRNGTDSPYVSCTPGAGGLVHRLASNGFYNAPWGQLQDQNPHFIIGVHALAVASGDRAAAQRLLPAVLAIADYLEANGLATTGIFTSPASGIANGGKCAGGAGAGANGTWEPACGSSQWYDVVLTGHFDGYNALLAVWALECLQDLMGWLGEGARAAHYGALHDRAARVFNELMWSEANAAYADWIDASNRARFYFFTDVQFKAVWLGVANATQAAAVMGKYDELVAGLVTQFNVTLEDVWGPPCNVVPITDPLEFVLELEAIEPVSGRAALQTPPAPLCAPHRHHAAPPCAFSPPPRCPSLRLLSPLRTRHSHCTRTVTLSFTLLATRHLPERQSATAPLPLPPSAAFFKMLTRSTGAGRRGTFLTRRRWWALTR